MKFYDVEGLQNPELMEDVVDELGKMLGVSDKKAWEILSDTIVYTAIFNRTDPDFLATPPSVLARSALSEYHMYTPNPRVTILSKQWISDADLSLILTGD